MPDIVVPVEPGYSDTFRSRTGAVGRDLDRRAERVENAARRQAGLWQNRLKPSMRRDWVASPNPNTLTMQVGSTVRHALVHHEGSVPHLIRARSNRVLRWVGKDKRVHFSTQVRHPGTRANRYLSDSLPLAVR